MLQRKLKDLRQNNFYPEILKEPKNYYVIHLRGL